MTNTQLGPLMLDLQGLCISSSEEKILQSNEVGGLILFSRNFNSLEQLQSLINQVRAIAPEIIIAVDHEGGRVQRFRDGFTRLPQMALLGEVYKNDKHQGLGLARDTGWLMASELISFDIDISFAPVLDIDYGESAVIGDRAFSSNPDEIIELTIAFIEGMKEAGMASTGKHYPGHGAVKADSHTEIPIDHRDLKEIEDSDLRIFKALCHAGMDAVMPAHVIYPQVCDQPAGFSARWLQTILREQYKFEGVIFSDDLGMEGASVAGGFIERTNAALEAGCDMILVCNKPDAANDVCNYLKTIKLPDGSRLSKMRLNKSKQLTWDKLRQTERWKQTNSHLSELLKNHIETQKQVGE